ncbi:MAG TPA: 30S ribosomal protein S8 [Candidatus Deferrimicrobium sp.]|nr:30S ribosomal protein S8 [Candidatus Kapabacteria bacterium]HLP59279.1 30S ribosomal protein S8 [Candidatus Deferrimicrobium sp.]
MSHTDPIADMLTRIKNAIMAEKEDVVVPLSKIKLEVAKILKREGYIVDFKVDKTIFPPIIDIDLKYRGKNHKDNVIAGVERISKPGRRIYAGADNIPKVLGGLGLSVLSTNKGLLTGKECEKHGVGGEVLLYVW